jgi:sialidase-1
MPRTAVASHLWIHGARDEYCAWPSVARLGDGSLVVVFASSEEHLGPTGRILSVRSASGLVWERPVVVRDSRLDDRDPGLTALRDGRLVAHLYSLRQTPERYRALAQRSYEPAVLDRWIRQVDGPSYRGAGTEEGRWVAVSEDGGHSWSRAQPGPDSVHGGIELRSGVVLVAAYREAKGRTDLWEGLGRPLEWRLLRSLEPPEVPDTHFGEAHLAELPSGRIVMAFRSTASPYDDECARNVLWLTYSDDAGRSWSEMRPTPLWGFPPHLLTLSDGRLLCTYGHRRPPYGQRACVSSDGVSWKAEEEIVLRADADNGDLGYPASAELGPGRILTVYYQAPAARPPPCMRPPDPARHKPGIWATTWDLPD